MSEIGRIIETIFPGVRVVSMPDFDLINQLLKLSETDKDQAIRHLISLFKTVTLSLINLALNSVRIL